MIIQLPLYVLFSNYTFDKKCSEARGGLAHTLEFNKSNGTFCLDLKKDKKPEHEHNEFTLEQLFQCPRQEILLYCLQAMGLKENSNLLKLVVRGVTYD